VSVIHLDDADVAFRISGAELRTVLSATTQSSRRLERECQRNIELVWLTGRLMPDFKTSRFPE